MRGEHSGSYFLWFWHEGGLKVWRKMMTELLNHEAVYRTGSVNYGIHHGRDGEEESRTSPVLIGLQTRSKRVRGISIWNL